MFSLANIIIQSAINSLGTVVMAASSAAFNIEIFTYDIVNAFGQACTTFVGQNFGAGELKRCKRTLLLCLAEGAVILLAAIVLIISFGKPLLSIFNSDPEVIDIGYIRVMLVVSAHFFSMLYEVMSRLSARLRHLARAGHSDDDRRLRGASAVDPVCLPAAAGRSARSCSSTP